VSEEKTFDMVSRAQYDEAKRVLEEIRYELDTQPLTLDQRRELECYAAGLSGKLLSPWLPVSWPRRLIAAGMTTRATAATGNDRFRDDPRPTRAIQISPRRRADQGSTSWPRIDISLYGEIAWRAAWLYGPRHEVYCASWMVRGSG
jgi:hypothetical protein